MYITKVLSVKSLFTFPVDTDTRENGMKICNTYSQKFFTEHDFLR
jgi:hypothetical protein